MLTLQQRVDVIKKVKKDNLSAKIIAEHIGWVELRLITF